MSQRTLVVVLFFWAVLTIITPILVRWSASAKYQIDFNPNGKDQEEIYTGRVLEMLPRRALVSKLAPNASSAKESESESEPAPAPAPTLTVALSLLGSKNSSNSVNTKEYSHVL